jgi:ribosomal protein S18 acetylase RimI-like enzyme
MEKMRPADFLFAVKLANTMDWSTTTEDFCFNAKLEPDGCFLLLDEQERVGVSTCISYGRVGWFGNLVVREAYRQKGAGSIIVKHAINYLKNKGVETIGLYTYPPLLEFYRKFGFKKEQDFLVLQAKIVSSGIEEKMKRARKQDLPAIVEFDKRCYGASRKKLLQEIILSEDNFCYVSFKEGEIVGYATAKVSGELAEVGPLVCRRNQPQTATHLLRAVLSKLEGNEALMYLPASEKNIFKTAIKFGFEEKFRIVRMFLGSHEAEECLYVAESLERG